MTARFNPARFAVYLLLVLFALIFLIPVYVLLSSSLKTFAEVQDLSKLWSPPQGLHLESFKAASLAPGAMKGGNESETFNGSCAAFLERSGAQAGAPSGASSCESDANITR